MSARPPLPPAATSVPDRAAAAPAPTSAPLLPGDQPIPEPSVPVAPPSNPAPTRPVALRQRRSLAHLPLIAGAAGLLLLAVFGVTVQTLQRELRAEIHQRLIERPAGVLHAMALQQVTEAAPATGDGLPVTAVLRSARQPGMLAVAVFDPRGQLQEAVPATLWFVDLAIEDFLQLAATRQPISRYHPDFDLARQLPGLRATAAPAPVLEVLVPLALDQAGGAGAELRGVVRYTLDGRPLAAELAALDARISRQTALTLFAGAGSIAVIVAAAAFALHRAGRLLLEREARLVRANLELSLAAKAAALGPITSHLLHGLQSPLAGLRAAVTRPSTRTATSAEWQDVADYTGKLQSMIEEAVGLLSDATYHTTYALEGEDLAALLRARHTAAASAQGVHLTIAVTLAHPLDSHRGGLLGLIAHNLLTNALHATPPGGRVALELRSAAAPGGLTLTVTDTGTGIPADVQATLFQPGRISRPGGTGLGLAISRLLARQLGGSLELLETGPHGTTFAVTLPAA